MVKRLDLIKREQLSIPIKLSERYRSNPKTEGYHDTRDNLNNYTSLKREDILVVRLMFALTHLKKFNMLISFLIDTYQKIQFRDHLNNLSLIDSFIQVPHVLCNDKVCLHTRIAWSSSSTLSSVSALSVDVNKALSWADSPSIQRSNVSHLEIQLFT